MRNSLPLLPLLASRSRQDACRLAIVLGALAMAPGCQWSRNYYESLKGEGFPEWSESLGASRAKDSSAVKPSGFFTDRRSEQIEKSLGGGF